MGMWLQSGLKEARDPMVEDNRNVLVAFAHIYINTKYVSQFTDYLAFIDLELDVGRFNSPGFARKVQQWNSDDLKVMQRQ
jgi:hypothetical protein